MIEKLKNTVSWSHVISDISGDKTVETIFEKKFRIE